MNEIVRWYLVLTVIGAGGLLPSLLVFARLRSGGVLFARPLALLLVAEGAWIISAVTPVPYSDALALALVLLLWAWSAWLAWSRPNLIGELRARGRLLLAGEALFAALFLVVLIITTQSPSAALNEQPFDLMLLNTIRNTQHMPAADAWLSGFSLAYYYLGQTMVDVAGRLSGLTPQLEYHLGFATAGAAAGASVFALAGDAVAVAGTRRRSSPWLAGGLAVVLLLFVSGTRALLDLLSANGVARDLIALLGIVALPAPAATEGGVPLQAYWWTRGSIVIPGTITEFPALTIAYANLHAHWLALALCIIALALALLTFIEAPPAWRSWRERPAALAVAAALFAGLVMTNTWDTVIYGAIWFLATAAAYASAGRRPLAALLEAARYIAVPAAAAFALAAPFLRTIHTPLAFALLNNGTRSPYAGGAWSDPARFLVVWLTLLLPLAGATALLRPGVSRRGTLVGAGVGVAAILAWIVLALVTGQGASVAGRGTNWLTLGALVVVLGFASSAGLRARRNGDIASAVCFGLAAIGAGAVLATELFYFVDQMGGRMNTVFKFWYATWALLAVAGAAGLAIAYDRPPSRGRLLAAAPLIAAAVVVTGASLLYLPAATISKERQPEPAGLDALAYLDLYYPDAAASIRWVREHVAPDDVVIEAASIYPNWWSGLSAATGRPTLLGWKQHEEIWRGLDPILDARATAVAAFYSRGATAENLAWARYFEIAYVRVGPEEELAYGRGSSVAARFEGWPLAFRAGAVSIFAVPR